MVSLFPAVTIVRSRPISIFSFIEICFLFVATAFLLLYFTFPIFVLLFPLFCVIGDDGRVSTPSGSGGLWSTPFALDVYLYSYKDYLDTERLDAIPSNGDAETVYDARNGLDRETELGA